VQYLLALRVPLLFDCQPLADESIGAAVTGIDTTLKRMGLR
jgi:hypothetical protein